MTIQPVDILRDKSRIAKQLLFLQNAARPNGQPLSEHYPELLVVVIVTVAPLSVEDVLSDILQHIEEKREEGSLYDTTTIVRSMSEIGAVQLRKTLKSVFPGLPIITS